MSNEWKYYNHAIIPRSDPHKSVDENSLENNSLWNDSKTLFARWTSDFDCGYETSWWFCIKDKPFDIMGINAKKRYEINKGNKNFFVNQINSLDYQDEMFEIYVEATSDYTTYNSSKGKATFVNNLKNNIENNILTFGVFGREDGRLQGYAYIKKTGCIEYISHKVNPKYEKMAVNAALVYGILNFYEEDLQNGIYICDGERNILHETNFQEYLEKYFEFRKAYCKLHLKYKPMIGCIVSLLYPARKVIYKIPHLKKVGAVLKMHEYYKTGKKGKNDK